MYKQIGVTGKPNHLLRDQMIRLLIYLMVLCVSGVFLWILLDLIHGGGALLSWDFLTDVPRDAGRAGGIGSILISTLLVLLIALLVALPVGWATAMLLAEFIPAMSLLGRWVRYSLQVLAGVPSIVFGLFGYAFFSIYLGMGFSILSGGLTLACMLLPILVSTAEAGLRAVPESYRLSAAALGMSRTATLFHLLLPVAAPAWAAGLLLGIGRAAAETAALMFTSGYVDRMPESLLDSGRVLALHIFDLSMNVPGGDAPAYASALVLIILLLVINLIAMQLIHFWQRRKLNTE
ncbi:phosphate ABC transporter permease PstA [Nitrosomonas sp. Nm132]|jgi:phosphate transport system permease protein|uniref:phosphate ABC transporter permease PstA n=1 Tax=Nitrosomonas sp. Nm132 TaxID=1881053 RepID=UPI00088BB283|nr:phosphate ABC transporter permease PstA [Nitrosomonas sp. Nm132]SDH15123.1 phosphate transport system permease protein [Nitrosomonas sp. Nm132]